MKRRETGIGWPKRLEVCVPSDWPTEAGSQLPNWFGPWKAWVDARYEYLRELGFSPADAQFVSVGDYPKAGDRDD